jgi:pyruvate,water dikinase
MAFFDGNLSTGLPKLDHILKGLMSGDNIVWHVNTIEEYKLFADPYYKDAVQKGKKINYFRFTRHAPIIKQNAEVETHHLNPENGFENFIFEIHKVIKKNGTGAYYIFDCLSDLAVDWYSDQMLANFFVLTCPYIYDLESLSKF